MVRHTVKRPASPQLPAKPAKRQIVTRSLTAPPPPEAPAPAPGPLSRLGDRRMTRSTRSMLASRGIDPDQYKEPMSWASLPDEIQRMILKALADMVEERPYFRRHFIANVYSSLNRHITDRDDLWMLRKPDPKATTRSSLATVSRQWQIFFEELNFRHLILHQDDLSSFEALTKSQLHRRRFVQGVYLRLELANYNCGACSSRHYGERAKNEMISNQAVAGLFTTLSNWDPTECHGGGLTLEMSAHSPSDARCYARELYNRIADNTYKSFRYEPSNFYLEQLFNEPWNPKHGWWRGHRQQWNDMSPSRRIAISEKLFSNTQINDWVDRDLTLPSVPCVSEFVIRRQFYQQLGCHALRRIIPMLSNLVSFRYEPWGAVSPNLHNIHSWDFSCLVGEVIRKHASLRRISIYGCTSQFYHIHHGMYDAADMPVGAVKGNILEESKKLAWAEQMDEIHAGRTACAEGFFYAHRPCDLPTLDATSNQAVCDSFGRSFRTQRQVERPAAPFLVKPEWPNLTHLSLSTTFLNKADDNMNWLLTAAGRAAENMPKLKMMELWNYDPRSRAIFRYSSNQGGSESGVARIELLTSWSAFDILQNHYTNNNDPRMAILISMETKNAWKEAVKAHCRYTTKDGSSSGEHRAQLLAIDEVVCDHDEHWGPCVIQHLKMKERILTPVSLEQMEKEGWQAPT